MKLSKDTLLRIVTAAMISMTMADDMRKLVGNPQTYTSADDVFSQLADALYEISGQKLSANDNFLEDAEVMKLLRSDLNVFSIRDEIARMAESAGGTE